MTCEQCEANLSSLLDKELSGQELIETMDHVANCTACMSFYESARSLDKMVLSTRIEKEIAPLPDGLWDSIEERSHLGKNRTIQLNSFFHPIWTAAAVIFLAFGLWAGSGFHLPGYHAQNSVIELGEDRGKMTEQRFVELTTELLRSDRRFHRKMLDVMLTVNQQYLAMEGSSEREVRGDGEERPESETVTQNMLKSGRERSTNPVEISFW